MASPANGSDAKWNGVGGDPYASYAGASYAQGPDPVRVAENDLRRLQNEKANIEAKINRGEGKIGWLGRILCRKNPLEESLRSVTKQIDSAQQHLASVAQRNNKPEITRISSNPDQGSSSLRARHIVPLPISENSSHTPVVPWNTLASPSLTTRVVDATLGDDSPLSGPAAPPNTLASPSSEPRGIETPLGVYSPADRKEEKAPTVSKQEAIEAKLIKSWGLASAQTDILREYLNSPEVRLLVDRQSAEEDLPKELIRNRVFLAVSDILSIAPPQAIKSTVERLLPTLIQIPDQSQRMQLLMRIKEEPIDERTDLLQFIGGKGEIIPFRQIPLELVAVIAGSLPHSDQDLVMKVVPNPRLPELITKENRKIEIERVEAAVTEARKIIATILLRLDAFTANYGKYEKYEARFGIEAQFGFDKAWREFVISKREEIERDLNNLLNSGVVDPKNSNNISYFCRKVIDYFIQKTGLRMGAINYPEDVNFFSIIYVVEYELLLERGLLGRARPIEKELFADLLSWNIGYANAMLDLLAPLEYSFMNYKPFLWNEGPIWSNREFVLKVLRYDFKPLTPNKEILFNIPLRELWQDREVMRLAVEKWYSDSVVVRYLDSWDIPKKQWLAKVIIWLDDETKPPPGPPPGARLVQTPRGFSTI